MRNGTVTHFDGRYLPKHLGKFDRVLCDAPCSGLGVIARDPAIKLSKTAEDVAKCSHLQKELILAAIDVLKPGGFLVYSTCSVSVAENEEVLNNLLLLPDPPPPLPPSCDNLLVYICDNSTVMYC